MFERVPFVSGSCALLVLVACSGNEGIGSTPAPSSGGATVAGAPAQGGSSAGGAGATSSVSGGQGSVAGSTSGGQVNAGGSPSTGGSGGSGGSGSVPLGGFGGAPEDKPGSVEVGVRNGCGFPLWIHGAGDGGVLMPDDQKLEHGDIVWYDAPEQWTAARITAFVDGPRQNEIDKAEMTFVHGDGGPVLNYNITYVDWLGLPIEIESDGGGGGCSKVGCYVAAAQVLSGCPDGLLEGKRCLAARSYCLNPSNQSSEYCSRLNEQIDLCASTKPDCAGAAGETTTDVYACQTGSFFSGSPKWCAALNRGMLDDPDSTDLSKFYKNEPYNTYAKWVHDVCPGIYAFPYDDYPSNVDESGFRSCTQGKELRITFCPTG